MTDTMHSREAESALIGAVLAEPQTLDLPDVAGLEPAAFYTEHHRLIWREIRALSTAGEGVDAVTVAIRLQASGHLAAIGGGATLLKLATDALTYNADSYARTIREMYRRREAIAAMRVAARAIQSGDAEPGAAIESVSARMIEPARNAATSLREPLGEIIESMEEAHAQRSGGAFDETTLWAPSSLPTWRDRHGGWRYGETVLIGGRPGMGKTGFLLGELWHAAAHGCPVYFASLEMTKRQVASRMLTMATGISRKRLETADIEPHDWDRVAAAVDALQSLELTIDDRAATIDELIDRARAAVRRGARLVAVDYGQLIRRGAQTSPKAAQWEVSGEIVKALTAFRKVSHVALLVAVQLNREGVGRPRMEQIREGGQWEQDAQTIVFPYRPHVDDPEADPAIGELVIGKNRDGETGIIPLTWEASRARYTETSYRDQPGIIRFTQPAKSTKPRAEWRGA